jgi:sec-independent protein translocase protein TatA
MHFLFISGAEIFVILVIVLMLFGADKIPDIARGLGKGMRQLKDATSDIKREITDTVEKQGIDTEFVKDIKKDITKVRNKVQDNIDDVTGPIKRNL